MARPKPEDLEEEFKKQDSEVYEPELTGEDDTVDILEDVIGNEPEDDKPFTIAEEVEKDELEHHEKPINDYSDEEESEETPQELKPEEEI